MWKTIIYNNTATNYSVSDNGEVRKDTNNYMMKLQIQQGYQHVTLQINGKPKRFRVHRLVAEAFIPNPENKPEIDHIDGNKSNNNVNNLRWCTHKENMNNHITRAKMDKYYKSDKFNLKICNPMKDQIHRAHHKDIMHSRFSGGNNMTAKKVLDLNTNIEYGCIKEYAEAINIPVSTVRNWLNGIYKFKKGYSAIIKEG